MSCQRPINGFSEYPFGAFQLFLIQRPTLSSILFSTLKMTSWTCCGGSLIIKCQIIRCQILISEHLYIDLLWKLHVTPKYASRVSFVCEGRQPLWTWYCHVSFCYTAQLTLLCIIFKIRSFIIATCSDNYVWGLASYWHVGDTCMTASSHREGVYKLV